jgi:hypothetical protein
VDTSRLSAEVNLRASPGIFLGGDDHVTLVLQNTGRDVGDLGLAMSLKEDWLAHHSMAMGTSPRCHLDASLHGFACGPVRSGESAAIVLRATASDPGTFDYGVAFYDMAGGPHAIQGSDGGDLVATFQETVTPLKT